MATALEVSLEGTDFLEISQSDGTVSHKTAAKLEDILEVEKTKCNIELTKEILTIHGTKKLCRSIPVASILSAVCRDKSNTTSQLTVQYIHKTGKSNLKISSICLKGDTSVCNAWETKLQEYIKLVPHRPQRLLIIVNPESGKRKGLKIYKSQVEPIFKLARIETEVVVTERAGHAEEMMSSRDLSGIDGLVLVGGDGIFHEVANGALRKIQKDSGIDIDNTYSSMKPLMIPVGMIPAGTGNGIAKEFFGCKDPEVAALAIVLGQSKPQSTFSVHANGKLLRYSIILLGYGFGADLAYEAEERRHLGTARYAYALTKLLVGNKQRCMDMEIEYLPEESPLVNKSESKDRLKEDWKKLEGRFSGIGTFCIWNNLNISDPRILHNKDKGAIVAVTKYTSRIQFINFLYRVVKGQVIELIDPDFSYLKLLAVHSFRVRLKSPSDPETKEGLLERLLNVDGEIHHLGATEFEARCRPGLVQLYHCIPSDDKKGAS
ncbi:hypothetical protein CHS0354_010801 [Potamilus streckersoni]|uniref:DAGKc domain-containing protein n=1 Tax=Potamilus streckersoni TaxID=2493646 RepID=A0AAE0WA84_9BIVA|nr:hypothetical protein CHS0354_010801 [Potamilus streckersoni]